jgi:hypothetical protein
MLAIVQHTPLWDFALLAVLIFLGIQALQPSGQVQRRNRQQMTFEGGRI